MDLFFFEWGENADNDITSDNYEKYREDYLNPLLKPYLNNYKKTHMDSYCLWGGVSLGESNLLFNPS